MHNFIKLRLKICAILTCSGFILDEIYLTVYCSAF